MRASKRFQEKFLAFRRAPSPFDCARCSRRSRIQHSAGVAGAWYRSPSGDSWGDGERVPLPEGDRDLALWQRGDLPENRSNLRPCGFWSRECACWLSHAPPRNQRAVEVKIARDHADHAPGALALGKRDRVRDASGTRRLVAAELGRMGILPARPPWFCLSASNCGLLSLPAPTTKHAWPTTTHFSRTS